MRLIKVKAFLEREKLFREMKPVDRRAKVLEFDDDAATEYAILSHRWVGQEVDYDEMVELAKMAAEERDEIRRRGSYRKILQSCKQAQKDRYEWLWVDTCCIDKRSSAELSEAINSMFRWYENAKVCYAYLHDVPSSSFPTARDKERYPEFNGWPEWFSRGWTLQELIAPSNIQFFNKDWKNIGDKKTLAPTLRYVTGIPEHILIDGLHGNRPCIAQIMSWAAHRTTTRVEDRAYSLMGLLDVNMPMLYGEGKKAFHRLQLEIIRISNDQSIFAWECNVRTGSVLADDPSDFQYCFDMELMGHDEFIEYIKADVPEEELDSIEDRLGTFLITNRGIQIWMLLRPYLDSPSRSHFQAWLPCRHGRWHPPVNISLVLWESNYYRCQVPCLGLEGPPRFCQVYLRYQDPPHRNATFEVDDSSLTENGFTCCDAYPEEFTGNALTLNGTDPLCVKVYSDRLTNHCFVVAFGQSFGKEWIRVIFDESTIFPRPSWRRDYTKDIYHEILVSTLEHAQYMDKARYGAERYGQVCIAQTCIPRTTRILRTSFVMWKSSKTCGVKLEVFHDPGFGDVSGEWSAFDVNGTDDPSCDWRGLMIFGWPRNLYDSYEIDGVPGDFSAAPNGIELGDYGHFSDCKEFCCEGNLFADLESLSLKVDITPRQYEISLMDRVIIWNRMNPFLDLYEPLMLLFPSNDDFKSLLTSFSTRLTNRYLVTRIIQCLPDPGSNTTTPLYSAAKPFVWYQNESAGPVSEGQSGEELRHGAKGDQVRDDDIHR